MADRTCRIRGCERTNIAARGLCRMHYWRWWKHGDVGQPEPMTAEQRIARIGPAKRGWNPSPETRRRMSASAKRRKATPETRAKISASQLGLKRKRGPLTDKQRRHLIKARVAKGPTRPELALRTLLDQLGVEFYEQEPFGVYTVDVFVPKIGLVIEADGAYWHRSRARERARDAYLLRNEPVRAVLHLTEAQLAPWMPRERQSKEYRMR